MVAGGNREDAHATGATHLAYTSHMLRRPALLAALVLVAGSAACAKDTTAPASPAALEAAESPAESPAEGLVVDASPRTTPLAVGDAAPAFTLTDASGESFSLAAKLESGPVIAIFYRGHW